MPSLSLTPVRAKRKLRSLLRVGRSSHEKNQKHQEPTATSEEDLSTNQELLPPRKDGHSILKGSWNLDEETTHQNEYFVGGTDGGSLHLEVDIEDVEVTEAEHSSNFSLSHPKVQEEEQEGTTRAPWKSLSDAFPAATTAECQRFHRSYPPSHNRKRRSKSPVSVEDRRGSKEAHQYLKEYLEWRGMMYDAEEQDDANFPIVTTTTSEQPQQESPQEEMAMATSRQQDQQNWIRAWTMAWNRAKNRQPYFPSDVDKDNYYFKYDTPTASNGSPPIPPQYMYAYRIPCSSHSINNAAISSQSAKPNLEEEQHHVVIQVIAARIDSEFATKELHCLAVSLYLDQIFDRHHASSQADVLMDVRGATGWPNHSPWVMAPVIRTCTHRLTPMFPERLSRLFIFPLPKFAVKLYNVIERFMPATVRERAVLVAGSGTKETTPMPMDGMVQAHPKQLLTLQNLQEMEDTRRHAIKEGMPWN